MKLRHGQAFFAAIAVASALYLYSGRPMGPIEHRVLVMGLIAGVLGDLVLAIVPCCRKKAGDGRQERDG